MKVLVTGASGFLGQHVLQALGSTEHEVIAISRKPVDDARFAVGDVLDPASLGAPMKGCDAVIHMAGLVDHSDRSTAAMHKLHVGGTQNIIEAARAAGVKRIVYLSTSGTVAVSDRPDAIATEDSATPHTIINGFPYYRSKLHAEQVALAAADSALEVVCLNPSLLLGPGDVNGSGTGPVRMFLDDQVPFCPTGGLSFADVRDVAHIAVAALATGTSGERYLLGAANMTFALFYERIARIADRQPPRWKAPKAMGKVLDWLPGLGRDGFPMGYALTRDDLKLAEHTWYLDDSKARDELGWAPRDPMSTLADTVADQRLALARGV